MKINPGDGPVKFMQKGYVLINGVFRNKEHPDTFSIPDLAQREGIRIGDFVKVGFERSKPAMNALFGERLWLRVTSKRGRLIYGRIDNDPLLPRLAYNMSIMCYPEHVLGIMKKELFDGKKAIPPGKEPLANIRPTCRHCG